MEIKSRANKLIKHITALSGRAYRESCGEFVIEGRRAVLDAIDAGADVSVILAREDYDGPLPRGEAVLAAAGAFDKAAGTVTPQGILAVAKMRLFDISSFTNSSVVICDNIRDPGNIGSIIRSAHAFGADVLLWGGCADIFSPKVVRASMGALFAVKAARARDLGFLRVLKERGYKIAAGALSEDAKLSHLLDLGGKAAFVVGNEGSGVSEEILDSADIKVKIPMPGGAQSLNAAVSAGIMLYEHTRQNMGRI